MSTQAITVKVENYYSDGHESTHEAVVLAPANLGPDDVEQWFEDDVYPHTGDGHGVGKDLGSCYVATILATDNPVLLGLTYEWSD